MTARGAAWQAQLDRLHDVYRRDRLASVHRTSPEVRVIADRGATFLGAWKADGPPDYLGVITDGRAVVFDAKDCQGDRFPLGQIARHQARDLEAAHLAGAAAGIALRLNGVTFWLPWDALGPLYWAWQETPGRAPAGTASITRANWWRHFEIDGAGWLSCVAT